MWTKDIKWDIAKKDDLDKDCDIIFDVLNNWISKNNIEYKIGLLEQCIEYLTLEKMTKYYEDKDNANN